MSKTYSLALIGILNVLLPVFGFEITDSGSLEQIVNALVLIGIAVDRFFKKDISIIGVRKTGVN
jgi:hypothetical protein